MCHEVGERVCLCLDSPYDFLRLVFWLPSTAAMPNFLNHHFWSLLSTDFLCRQRGLSSLCRQIPNFLACKLQRLPVALAFLLQLVQLCANLVPQNITNTQSHSAWSEAHIRFTGLKPRCQNGRVLFWRFQEEKCFLPFQRLQVTYTLCSKLLLRSSPQHLQHLTSIYFSYSVLSVFLSSKYDHKTDLIEPGAVLSQCLYEHLQCFF